ncbi:MAG: hypothetical protein ND866_27895 [Pyrinomonadaceae bacterium]|nr:hypothetical protein [Pyrinomonadaceae bacterium]
MTLYIGVDIHARQQTVSYPTMIYTHVLNRGGRGVKRTPALALHLTIAVTPGETKGI